MPPTADTVLLERRLLAEMGDLERKIRELVVERDSIRRLLQRVRSETLINVDVTRKNSFNRILVEHTIIEAIKLSLPKPLSTNKLAGEAKAAVYGLKDSTLRSYLFRMKERGLIVNKGVGFWTLPPQPAQ
jgi:hypothetical protein